VEEFIIVAREQTEKGNVFRLTRRRGRQGENGCSAKRREEIKTLKRKKCSAPGERRRWPPCSGKKKRASNAAAQENFRRWPRATSGGNSALLLRDGEKGKEIRADNGKRKWQISKAREG